MTPSSGTIVSCALVALACFACAAPEPRICPCDGGGVPDATHRDAFITRDAWRAGWDSAITGPAPCRNLIAPSRPLPDAVLGLEAQVLAARGMRAAPYTFEVCADAACDAPLRSITTSMLTVQIAPPLPAGHYLWRIRDVSGVATPSWPFHVATTAPFAGRRPLDIDADGLADIVVSSEESFDIEVWTGALHDRPLAAAPIRRTVGPAVHAGDVDGDGVSDLMAAYGYGLYVFGGARCDPLAIQWWTPLTGSLQHEAIGIGDADGDGRDDVGVSVEDTTSTSCAAYIAFATAGRAPFHVVPIAPSAACSQTYFPLATVRDWSGDGLPDVAIGRPDLGRVEVRSPAAPSADPFALVNGPWAFGIDVVDAGDLDGDGSVELAIGSAMTDPLGYSTFTILIAHASGALNPTGITDTQGLRVVALGDFDADGFDDLAISTSTELHLLFGGPIALTALHIPLGGLQLPTAGWFRDLLTPGDVDGDGAADLVVVAGLEPDVEIIVYEGGSRALVERARMRTSLGAAVVARR